MRATIAALSAILLVGTVGASAAPMAAATTQSETTASEAAASPMRLAQRDHRDRDRDGRWQREQRRHHHRGYERRHGPPSGWHRFRSRPHDYSRRGCMQIGPAWFCP
ncbi:hypothetical protein HL667_32935 [Bradyrhizobium sp. 83012]|uniref:Uncharacterized protein n=1 Tax=Bradyrhizobium aeschynomenes TaxID=2734909 RepID=A0ABX2CRC3_9BRAD|nr:hypothetical protein [Bradyrhizobium aeschynomenes]NPU15169.1 hypothetical protein [Bradyrhizobium aeschynomenes]NPU69837.1 hypothetical protein [Bradyrhizobium aeschynomenes]NPV24537.1 hypothetical protein [Bradyrhizobium aeschynomenes]